jgi:hypothetical protein
LNLEPETGVPGQGDGETFGAVYKCRLCVLFLNVVFALTFQSLNRVCQDSETREVLERVSKQVVVLQQSAARVASSSEQFGAVQQVTLCEN